MTQGVSLRWRSPFRPCVARFVPTVRSAVSSLWAVALNPRKRVKLFGGNVATELLFAVTLGAASHAYGVR
jgi:hypothetical protein